ncbi:MAG: RloB family protein [Chitinophagales bacterium]
MPKKSRKIKVTDKKKAWNKRKARKPAYLIEQLEKKKVFLIICEGENTEPQYFLSFPVKTARIKSYGLGSSKTKLVEYVLEIVKEENDQEQEVWIVFDMDVRLENVSQQKGDYENAIRLAEENEIHVAYSNDSFELWFILHYKYTDVQLKRYEYYKQLNDLWNCNYEEEGKKVVFCRNIYKLLEEDEKASITQAIANAEKLLEKQKGLRLSEQNPSTTVHRLVIKLLEER